MRRFKEVAYGLSPYGSWSQKRITGGLYREGKGMCEHIYFLEKNSLHATFSYECSFYIVTCRL